MKFKLLGGAALAIALAVSSGAWANPKNSFSNFNTTVVYSVAVANSGHIGYGGGNGSAIAIGTASGTEAGVGNVSQSGNNTSVALSESFNKSIEGVEVSYLSSVSTGYIGQYGYYNSVFWGDANANAGSGGTNSGLFQASASNGVGNATTQGQSIAAAAEVSFE